MDLVVREIKKDEGFSGMPYNDSRGLPTIGYGTLLPISEYEAELLLKHRLEKIKMELLSNKPILLDLPQEANDILLNMAYNLGVPRLMKFKKMWKALKNKNYIKASEEMKDSKWYHQVGNRAERLVKRMRNISE